jgi:hypothetical protein
MLKDFLIADNVGVKIGAQYADLHNDYDLTQIRIGSRDSIVEIEFKLRHEAANMQRPATIVFRFSNVDWFQTSHGVANVGDGDLAEIGYKEPEDTDHNWLIREEQAAAESHMFFRLTNDEYIRIHARKAQALLSP